MPAITGFKAYDYRGRIPSELNPDVAYRIGHQEHVLMLQREVADRTALSGGAWA